MISVRFQGKEFNTTVIQAYAPTTNIKEAETEQFYEDLQDLLVQFSSVVQPCPTLLDLLELTTKKDVLFIIRD